MKQLAVFAVTALTLVSVAGLVSADVTIASFDEFNSDALYESWAAATIESTPTNYVITATGYGSNYKFIGSPPVEGVGATKIQLDVTLSGPSAANGKLGPIVDLIDGDGTRYSYRWYGQPLGHRVLTMLIKSPTAIVDAGTVPGLDLSQLLHMHLQLDPGSFGTSGAYTVAWNDLLLTGFPPFAITAEKFNPVTQEFTLTWNSISSKTYSILCAPDLSGPFTALVTAIDSGGTSTTATVVLPTGTYGYVRVQQE
jgi:hypothetical protein